MIVHIKGEGIYYRRLDGRQFQIVSSYDSYNINRQLSLNELKEARDWIQAKINTYPTIKDVPLYLLCIKKDNDAHVAEVEEIVNSIPCDKTRAIEQLMQIKIKND